MPTYHRKTAAAAADAPVLGSFCGDPWRGDVGTCALTTGSTRVLTLCLIDILAEGGSRHSKSAFSLADRDHACLMILSVPPTCCTASDTRLWCQASLPTYLT